MCRTSRSPPDELPQEDAEPASTRNAYRRAPLSAIAAAALTIGVALLDIIVVSSGIITEQVDGIDESDQIVARVGALIFFGLLFLIELLLVRAFLRRGRRARVVLMTVLSLSILSNALNYLYGVTAVQLDWTLVSASLQCIALIAYATDSTARWVRGRGDEVASGAAAVRD